MMRPCQKCLENNWTYKVFEKIVKATCVKCGNIVEFEAKKSVKEGRKQPKEGDKCGRKDRDCSGILVWKQGDKMTPKRLKNAYHFEKWLKCNKCGAMFMNDKYKILHETSPDGSIMFRRAIEKI